MYKWKEREGAKIAHEDALKLTAYLESQKEGEKLDKSQDDPVYNPDRFDRLLAIMESHAESIERLSKANMILAEKLGTGEGERVIEKSVSTKQKVKT